MANAFVAGTAIASAVAPVAAPPTTAAHFCLFNGERPGGKSYTITSVGATYTTSAAAAENTQLFAHVSVGLLTNIPTATAAQGPSSMGGGQGSPTQAKVGSTVTIVNDGVWHPVGWSNFTSNTATIALGVWTNLLLPSAVPIYVIPPGGMISFAVVSSTAAAAAAIFCTWTEA